MAMPVREAGECHLPEQPRASEEEEGGVLENNQMIRSTCPHSVKRFWVLDNLVSRFCVTEPSKWMERARSGKVKRRRTGTRRGKDFKSIRKTRVTVGIIFKLLLANGLCLIKCSSLLVLRPGPLGFRDMWVTHIQHTYNLQTLC